MDFKTPAKNYIKYRQNLKLDWLDKLGYQLLLVTIIFVLLLGCSKKEEKVAEEVVKTPVEIIEEVITPPDNRVKLEWIAPTIYQSKPLPFDSIVGYKLYIHWDNSLLFYADIPDRYQTTFYFNESETFPKYFLISYYTLTYEVSMSGIMRVE